MTEPSKAASIPPVAHWFQEGFHRFLGRYLSRHFHAVAVVHDARPDLGGDSPHALRPDESVIVFGNHPSWWDPLIGHFLNRQLFTGRQFYAPIDADALKQYQVFEKLGFFGVQQSGTMSGSDSATSQSARLGASTFLKVSNLILAKNDSALWITPEGRFADARDRSESLMPGLAHLCHRNRRGQAIAMALEYVFWDERLPVCLARFSEPISFADNADWSKADWMRNLTDTMRSNQDALAQVAIARDSKPLDNLLAGKTGAGGIYDGFRRVKSWIKREPFQPRHGNQFQ